MQLNRLGHLYEGAALLFSPLPTKSDRILGIENIGIQSLLVMGMEQITQLLLSFLSLRTHCKYRTHFLCVQTTEWKWCSIFTHSWGILKLTQFEGFSRFYVQLTPAEVDGSFCGKLTVARLIRVRIVRSGKTLKAIREECSWQLIVYDIDYIYVEKFFCMD
jgi:hypothetical protein